MYLLLSLTYTWHQADVCISGFLTLQCYMPVLAGHRYRFQGTNCLFEAWSPASGTVVAVSACVPQATSTHACLTELQLMDVTLLGVSFAPLPAPLVADIPSVPKQTLSGLWRPPCTLEAAMSSFKLNSECYLIHFAYQRALVQHPTCIDEVLVQSTPVWSSNTLRRFI